jgi:hypothetical protein
MDTATGRVQLLNTPVAAPGTCILCGGADKPVVDFGKQIEWYGAVYFCMDCIREVSQVIGYVPVDSFDKLHTEYRELKLSHEALTEECKTVKDALGKLLYNGSSSGINPGNSEPAIVEDPHAKFEAALDAASGDSSSEQSDSVEGSDDLFDDSDFDHE